MAKERDQKHVVWKKTYSPLEPQREKQEKQAKSMPEDAKLWKEEVDSRGDPFSCFSSLWTLISSEFYKSEAITQTTLAPHIFHIWWRP